MKLLLLPNRLVRPVFTGFKTQSSITSSSKSLIIHQRRHASNSSEPKPSGSLHPILADYYKHRPAGLETALRGEPAAADVRQNQAKMPSQSIFGEAPEEAREENAVEIYDPSTGELQDDRSRDLLNVVLDPKPFQRWRWERARIIKDARRGWRISKEDYLKRTERQCVENSVWLKTSVKKLSLLARMLAGKNIDEALLQLRFSKKRTADEVAKHLEHARDMAIVKWGMGLGEVEDRKGDPIEIRLKDGTKKMITDRTAIYIEQAMVQRGSYELQAEIRARGKTNFLRKPYSAIRFVLKEEHTRIREFQEREEKKLRKKPFIPLPDKPITQQRQYILW